MMKFCVTNQLETQKGCDNMRITSMQGSYEDAQQLVFEESAAFVELGEVQVSKDSMRTRLKSLSESRSLVISMHNWERKNTEDGIGGMYESIAEFCALNDNRVTTITLVFPDFMQGLLVEDGLRRMTDTYFINNQHYKGA
jgi:hypothetical protein